MNNINKKYSASFLLSLLLVSGLSSCKKDDKNPVDSNNNKISRVIADNFNLSVFNAGLGNSGLKPKMLETGPFTVLAPSDAAMATAGFNVVGEMISPIPGRVTSIMNYHILNGRYEFNKLPFLFNQEVRSSNGGKLFVTRWVKDRDTILAINGARVLAQNIQASNGLVQVIDRMLEPYTYDVVVDAIASDRSLSLFYQALQRAGMVDLLKGKGPYTVFAPDNNAMTAYGLSSLELINNADPATLASMIRYHVFQERRFVYDYILSSGTVINSKQAMLDGNLITVTLAKEGGSVVNNTITLRGIGNSSIVRVLKRDWLTGNGVVHSINSVLKITQ